MVRGLSYGDAVRLLGGKDSKIVTALDKVTGGILLGAAVTVPALLAWIEARAEFARLCQDLVRAFSERRSGLSRYDRTQRLEAAHAVLVMTAYFEALAAVDLPFRFADLRLTKAEELVVADDGSVLSTGLASLTSGLVKLGQAMIPEPGRPYESVLADLESAYYPRLSAAIAKFVRGLAVWDEISDTDRDRFDRALEGVPAGATGRYEQLFRALAVDFPEVAFWANLRGHQATRAEVGKLSVALARLEQMLSDISTGRTTPGATAVDLADIYRKELEQPIAESGDVPEGLMVPTLGEAYVPTRFRVRSLTFAESASDEAWWEQAHIRDDLEEFFVGYLTSPQATRTPLLVLGQPGSGKSVLTRVLAARLPVPDFLPVRVILRNVPADADIQEQIEHAVRATTGYRLDWPDLASSAGDALPVILLDGFDELLQATGVSQTDYLAKVADFQRREASVGRPAAVVVTSRTSVANRARAPEQSVALRLEPFDPERVTAWLKIWNTVNADRLKARGLLPLTPQVVLAHDELVGQPLLLLMLALYDADGNALQHLPADLQQGELYERLLRRFVRREVMRNRPSLPDGDIHTVIEDELRRLSIVAFAMFNRGSQWVTEANLDIDLAAVFGHSATPPVQAMRATLRAAEIVLGQFFFIHRSQARRDEARLETYEFLHASFGEFLVARFTAQVLSDIAARHAASTMTLAAAPPDDDLLHALLSFAVLSVRSSIIAFLAEAFTRLAEPDRAVRAMLLKGLLRVAHQPRPGRRLDSYQPSPLTVPARHAAYSANLVLLIVCVTGRTQASEMFAGQPDPVEDWHRQALLWRSQLGTEEWTSLVETLALDRRWDGQDHDERREIELSLDNDTSHPFRAGAIDLRWTYGLGPPPHSWQAVAFTNQAPDALRRKAHFLCGINDDVVQHTVEPLLATIGDAVGVVIEGADGTLRSPASALMEVWLLPLSGAGPEQRRAAYRECAAIASSDVSLEWEDPTRCRYAALLLDRLCTDDEAPASLAADILGTLSAGPAKPLTAELATRIIRCGLAFLGQDRGTDQRIAEVLADLLAEELYLVRTEPGLEAWVRLAELDLPFPGLLLFDRPEELTNMVQSVAGHRPDLAERAQRLIRALESDPGLRG